MKSWLGALLTLIALPALALAQPPRWIQADDLRVRTGPGLEHKLVGVLRRGDAVILKSPEALDGYCLIEGEGHYGYVACQYLSVEPVARPRAGQGDVPADWRWVIGGAVNLRAAPRSDAEVLQRLAMNSMVRGLGSEADSGYCEVQPLDRSGAEQGARGFTGCQFLAPEPLRVAALLSGSAADTPAERARAFWLQPSWGALESYAQLLSQQLPQPSAGPWPRDAELERMKAHLALGLKARAPEPMPDWAELKQLAGAHDAAVLDPASRERAQAAQDRELLARESRAASVASRLQQALGLWGPLHDSISAEGGAARVLRLVQALELPRIQPSLFRRESEIGPPGAGAEALAGRFGGIYRTLTTPRSKRPAPASKAGLYDMLSVTRLLTRPLQFVRLFRDGRLQSEASTARWSEVLWRDVDGPMCEGWTPGFGYGAAEASIWRYFDSREQGGNAGQEARTQSERGTPPGSLFAFYALAAPPQAQAEVRAQRIALSRAATGFVAAYQLQYDLDADGQPDLLIWEGVGKGPGHMDSGTRSDDAWIRVAFVNLGGAWKVLGHDVFGYGCGC